MDATHRTENTKKTLGQALRHGRKSAGLTIRQLATDIGINRGHLSKLEHDFYRRPNLQILSRLATRLKLEYADLVALTGQAAPEHAPSLPRYIVSRYDVTEEEAVQLAEQWQQVLNQAHINERSTQSHLELEVTPPTDS